MKSTRIRTYVYIRVYDIAPCSYLCEVLPRVDSFNSGEQFPRTHDYSLTFFLHTCFRVYTVVPEQQQFVQRTHTYTYYTLHQTCGHTRLHSCTVYRSDYGDSRCILTSIIPSQWAKTASSIASPQIPLRGP